MYTHNYKIKVAQVVRRNLKKLEEDRQFIGSLAKETAFFLPVQQINTNDPNNADNNTVGQDATASGVDELMLAPRCNCYTALFFQAFTFLWKLWNKGEDRFDVLNDTVDAVSVAQEPVAGCLSWYRESWYTHWNTV